MDLAACRYLAFISAYTTIYNLAVTERDVRQFLSAPPNAHNMLKFLEHHGLILRQPGVARSIQLFVAPKSYPAVQRHK